MFGVCEYSYGCLTFVTMRIILIFTFVFLIGTMLFFRFYQKAPKNFKNWLGRLIGILAILGWIYLLIKIR